ncbi:hypothetical protein [Cellvibrio zantedeschiae]|uniref:hypothetical protein n=1 Tax=Cellvibrio zantedeschiae TaxID=1237077 RepID=UPI00167BCCD4|nr:hypothetical protein [Cellvibrio zantedeschiae]
MAADFGIELPPPFITEGAKRRKNERLIKDERIWGLWKSTILESTVYGYLLQSFCLPKRPLSNIKIANKTIGVEMLFWVDSPPKNGIMSRP